jgi:hypothetical protein
MTDKDYFIEPTDDGRFSVKAAGANRASAICDTQAEAIAQALEYNPDNKPHVARVRNTVAGHPNQFRKV